MNLGCFYCHDQQVEARLGHRRHLSEGDYVYDSPHALGTERTDQTSLKSEECAHNLAPTPRQNPRSVSPGSIMPNFGYC